MPANSKIVELRVSEKPKEKIYKKLFFDAQSQRKDSIIAFFEACQLNSSDRDLLRKIGDFVATKVKRDEPNSAPEDLLLSELIEPYMPEPVPFSPDKEAAEKVETVESLRAKIEQERVEREKLVEVIDSTREILMVLGNKTKETVYFLENYLDPPITKWMTPRERKSTGSQNNPKNSIDFYQKRFSPVSEYMTQAVLRQYDIALMNSIRTEAAKKGETRSVGDIVPAKAQKYYTEKLIQIVCKNLQMSSSDLFKVTKAISASFYRNKLIQ